ncbi:VanZ family protein, partial [candidate division KSB1 bacterium]|nr:VanZ family protein [candidate division KSB1 bacterium]
MIKKNWHEYELWQKTAQKTAILRGVYLVYILILTLKPFNFSPDYLYQHFKFEQGLFVALFSQLKIDDIILNILFFMPYGFLTGLLARFNNQPKDKALKKIIFYSLIISALAEICQLFSIRSSSLFDVFMNGLGGCIGGLWSYQINLERSYFMKFILNRGAKCIRLTAWIYLFLLIASFSLPFWLNSLSNWNENFHLLLGNEATEDRPWAGTFYKVAIYDHMLTETEILQCYYQRCPNTVKPHLMALYCLDKDSGEFVQDRSLVKPNLDLKIHKIPTSAWQKDKNGLKISSGVYLKSENPAKKIIHHAKKSNQFSIEVLFEPENLTQTGPARIISCSNSTDERNFTLGQVGQNLNFRVRTPLTGLNGSKIDLFIEQPVLKREKQHI